MTHSFPTRRPAVYLDGLIATPCVLPRDRSREPDIARGRSAGVREFIDPRKGLAARLAASCHHYQLVRVGSMATGSAARRLVFGHRVAQPVELRRAALRR